MKKTCIAIVALTLFGTNVIFCANNSPLVLGSSSQELFPEIKLLKPLKLDYHAAARYKAGITNWGFGLANLTKIRPVIQQLGLPRQDRIFYPNKRWQEKNKHIFSEAENGCMILERFWNGLVKNYNKAAIKINNLPLETKKITAKYGAFSCPDLKNNPAMRKKIYNHLSAQEINENENKYLYLALVETTLREYYKKLKLPNEEIGQLIYGNGGTPHTDIDRPPEYLNEFKRKHTFSLNTVISEETFNEQEFRRKKFTSGEYFGMLPVYWEEDLIDPINKKKIDQMNDMLETGGVKQQYNIIRNTFELLSNFHFYSYDNEAMDEFKKFSKYRQIIPQIEKMNDYKNKDRLFDAIKKYKKEMDTFNKQNCDEIFDEYMPKQSYEITQEVIEKLQFKKVLQLHPYPEVIAGNLPQETTDALKKLITTYKQDFESIPSWNLLVTYCDQEAIKRMANVLFMKNCSNKNSLGEMLQNHRNALSQFITLLNANSIVIGNLSESIYPNTIKYLIEALQTQPDDWQIQNSLGIQNQ